MEACATPNNQQTPTIKVDQILPDNSKLSFYFNKLTTNQFTTQNCMPYPIAVVRVQAIYGTVPRLNYDKSITPTILLHAGCRLSALPQSRQFAGSQVLQIRRGRTTRESRAARPILPVSPN